MPAPEKLDVPRWGLVTAATLHGPPRCPDKRAVSVERCSGDRRRTAMKSTGRGQRGDDRIGVADAAPGGLHLDAVAGASRSAGGRRTSRGGCGRVSARVRTDPGASTARSSDATTSGPGSCLVRECESRPASRVSHPRWASSADLVPRLTLHQHAVPAGPGMNTTILGPDRCARSRRGHRLRQSVRAGRRAEQRTGRPRFRTRRPADHSPDADDTHPGRTDGRRPRITSARPAGPRRVRSARPRHACEGRLLRARNRQPSHKASKASAPR